MNPKKIKGYYKALVNSKRYQFSKLKSVTKNLGVYVIYSKNGTVLHVGRSKKAKEGLYQRLTNHKNGQSSFVRIFFAGDKKKLKNCTFKCIEILMEESGLG
jgi:hypothetical protein